MLLAAGAAFGVSPNAGILLWPLIAVLLASCGVLTAAKGRWGWLLVGFFTMGLGWVAGARQAPAPGSVWARRSVDR
jgi:hypothetical protein